MQKLTNTFKILKVHHTLFVAVKTKAMFILLINVISLQQATGVQRLLNYFGYESAIFKAVKAGDPEALEGLIKAKVNVNAQDADGRTALSWAAMKGFDNCMKLLIAAKADVNIPDKSDRTPLHWSAMSGHEECIRLLIAAKAHLNVQAKSGNTPLHLAAASGCTECIELLIFAGADSTIKNNDKVTPAQEAKDDATLQALTQAIEDRQDRARDALDEPLGPALSGIVGKYVN